MKLWGVFCSVFPFLISLPAGAGPAFLNPPQFVVLLPKDAYEILERQNRLKELCPATNKETEKCQEQAMTPVEKPLTAYERADSKSKVIGKIKVKITPGEGAVGSYEPAGGDSEALTPDFSDSDWGYGSYFMFTVAARLGDWIRLPKGPFATPVWVNPTMAWGADSGSVGSLEIDRPYNSGSLGAIVFKDFKKDGTVSYRRENGNDMLCGNEPSQIPAEKLKVKTISVEKLFDENGHLTVWPKYTRGC